MLDRNERKALRVVCDEFQRQVDKLAEGMQREQRIKFLEAIARGLERTLESIPRKVL